MAKGDRGSRGRKEYAKTERERGEERRRKERERRDRRQDKEDREARRKAHAAKIKAEREAEAAKPKRGSEEELRDRAERQEKWERERQEQRERSERERKDRSWTDRVKDFFSGEDKPKSAGPVGGAKSYGMSRKDFDESIGRERHEQRGYGEKLRRQVEYFEEAPMDYISDMLDNPLIAGAVMMSGMALPAFGVKVVDALMDYNQLEASLPEALSNVGYGALQYTPVGSALPAPLKTVAKQGLKKGAKGAAGAVGGVAGGKLGAEVGLGIAGSLTDNPLVSAGITAGAAAAGTFGGKKVVETALNQAPRPQSPDGPVSTPSRDRDRDRDRPQVTSKLVESGEKAIASSRALMASTGPTDLYAQTVKQLPYYGISSELMGEQPSYYQGLGIS